VSGPWLDEGGAAVRAVSNRPCEATGGASGSSGRPHERRAAKTASAFAAVTRELDDARPGNIGLPGARFVDYSQTDVLVKELGSNLWTR
jgi:hypothetical protein